MPNVLGVEFAPMDVPLHRRLQSLAVVLHLLFFVAGGPVGYVIVAYVILFTRFYWLALAYVCYMIGERGAARRGSYPSMWVRRWAWWRYYRDYFPVKLVKTAELDPSNNYLLCCYPHGVLPFGVFTNFATEANNVSEVFPGIQCFLIVLNELFNMPFPREIAMRLGICSAARDSLDYLLTPSRGTGRAAALIVGGASEALKSRPGAHKIILNKRKGFIKVALHNGASLVPVFSFGENEVYNQVDNPEGGWIHWAQDVIRKKTGIAPVLMIGRGIFQYSFGLMPLRRPLVTVVGKPIPVERVIEPTQEEIDTLHARFTEELIALYEEHKHHYVDNSENTSLIIE